MRRLIMCQGLPGSGKSTWATDQARRNPGTVVVTKDDIRQDLEAQGWQWSRENEADVIETRDVLITSAFKVGAHTVISADTNFGRKHKEALANLATSCGAAFEVQRFVVPVDECVRRDAAREKSVGVSVIHGMVRQYALDKDSQWYGEPATTTVLKYSHQPGLPWAIICDIDGTAAKMVGRSPFDESRVSEDLTNVPVLATVKAISAAGYGIVYMSGRHESTREDTERWLQSHGFPGWGALYLRSNGDSRHDDIVKGELFDAHVRGRYNILFALDDRQSVVDFWRSIGLTVFQVAPGKF